MVNNQLQMKTWSILLNMNKKNILLSVIVLFITIIILIGISILEKENLPVIIGQVVEHALSSSAPAIATPELKAPAVIIDPGHGGWEPGAGNGSINEKDVVLAISLEIEKVLIQKNIDYYMIRRDDSYLSPADRVKIANEMKASLFVSIHNNSFTDASQTGILTAYNPYSPVGKDIASIMQSKLRDIGMRDRDIVPRSKLVVLRDTQMPSLLLEIGFISSKKDLALITNPAFQQECAERVVSGIEDILASLSEQKVP